MKQSSVSVVSIFGRGHSLAARLQQAGIPTVLVDLSSSMGVWSPEEAEGPFGFFKSDRLSGQQLARLNADDPVIENEPGLTVWFGKRLLELKSQVTPTLCQQFGLNLEEMVLGQPLKNLEEKFLEQFQSARLPSLAKLSKSNLVRSQLVQNPLLIRQVTRTGLQKSLNWVEQQGVEVISDVKALDLSMLGKKKISGIELSGKTAGIFKSEMWIWCLTSEETRFVNERISDKLFEQEIQESTWSWMKFRFSISECRERKVLPYHWIYVQDIEAPWTHENMMIIQKTASEDLFDCWVRLPTLQRFNKDYLLSRGQDLKMALATKIPAEFLKLHSFPQEYNYTYSDLGAPRFPLFETEPRLPSLDNVEFNSPESWSHYGWESILLSQAKVQEKMISWWKKKVEREERLKAKESKK